MGFKSARAWLVSKLNWGGHDEAGVQKAIERLLENDFSTEACQACLTRMQAVEQRKLNAQSYRFPLYFWRRHISKDAKMRFNAGWVNALAGKEGLRDQLLLLLVAARVAHLNEKFEEALAQIAFDTYRDLDLNLLMELCGLTHSQRRYQDLLELTTTCLGRADTADRQAKCLMCDYHFQAAYQLLKNKIFRNKLTSDDVADLRARYETCRALLGADTGNVHHYRALLACVEGDLDKAVQHHMEAHNWAGYSTQFFQVALNLISVADMAELANLSAEDHPENPDFYDEIQMIFRHKPGGSVTMIACDEGYFRSYARGFCESFGLQNPGGLLHVHAIGFEPASDELDALERDFAIAINLTLDPGPAKRDSGDIFRGYCAGSRYIHLPRYQAHYDHIIITDIDGIVHTSVADIWRGLERRILLSTLVLEDDRKGHFAFWSNIGAGAFGIGNLDDHKRFACALSNYLTLRFNACQTRDERFFFSDQVGLLLCVLAFSAEVPMVRMPQLFRQSTQTSQIGRDSAKKNAQSELLQKIVSRQERTIGK